MRWSLDVFAADGVYKHTGTLTSRCGIRSTVVLPCCDARKGRKRSLDGRHASAVGISSPQVPVAQGTNQTMRAGVARVKPLNIERHRRINACGNVRLTSLSLKQLLVQTHSFHSVRQSRRCRKAQRSSCPKPAKDNEKHNANACCSSGGQGRGTRRLQQL